MKEGVFHAEMESGSRDGVRQGPEGVCKVWPVRMRCSQGLTEGAVMLEGEV